MIAKRATESQLDNIFWELEDEWVDSSSRRYNAMYRDCGHAMDEIHERLDRHSALLGYTTAYCFSIASGLILYDPNPQDINHLCALSGNLSSPVVQQISEMLNRLDEWLSRTD
jgi:hypothetical protein